MEHDGCKGCRYERENADSVHCQGCKQNAVDKYVKRTNANRIKSMNTEELAEFLLKVNDAYAQPCMTGETDCKWQDYPTHDKGCKDRFKEWLESECDVE